MAPRLRLLLLLLPAGCAAPGDREAVTAREAMESSRASLAAFAPAAPLPPRPAPAALRGVPRTGLIDVRHGTATLWPASAAQLLGAGPEALRRWLGEPSLRRREGTAEVWLYAGEACALDLVLYPAGGGLRVAHAEARASGTEQRTEAACLAGIGGTQGARAMPATAGPAEGAAPPADQGA